jgi:CRISPR-associated protein Cas2
MESAMKVFLACYDIEDDTERERLARLLGEYGERVQKSVFELSRRVASILEDGTNLRLYRLCEHCRSESRDMSGEPIARVPSAIIL